MPTLLIELAGPQQAWGSRSRFTNRATELAPTKSGVVGLLAAALGLDRTAPLDAFEQLRFGVRIDQPGRLERDFQTTRSLDGKTAFPLSTRFYIADAVFLAAVEADRSTVDRYRAALARPYFPLFLGRRAFPPSGPIPTDVDNADLMTALRSALWRARKHHRQRVSGERVHLEVIRDVVPGEVGHDSRQDVPRSFDPRRRRHDTREVVVTRVEVLHPDPSPRKARRDGGSFVTGSATAHDPEALLSDEEV